jgi:hypothetical protein
VLLKGVRSGCISNVALRHPSWVSSILCQVSFGSPVCLGLGDLLFGEEGESGGVTLIASDNVIRDEFPDEHDPWEVVDSDANDGMNAL